MKKQKTIINQNPEELDKEVNKFIESDKYHIIYDIKQNFCLYDGNKGVIISTIIYE